MINKFINQHILDLKKYDPVDSDKKLAEEFGLKEKEVIKIMKDNLKRNSFLKWRQRVRGRKTKISSISDRFKSSNQKT